MKGENAQNIRGNQQGQYDPGGFPRGKNICHEDDRKKTKGPEAGLGKAGTNRGQRGQKPGVGGEFGHGR